MPVSIIVIYFKEVLAQNHDRNDITNLSKIRKCRVQVD